MDSVNENVHSCISQMKRSQAVLCQGSDSTTRFWVFMRLSYFSIYLLLSIFQHYWYLRVLLHIKKDAWAVLEGACNTQKHSTCGCFLSFQNSWRGGWCWPGRASFSPRLTVWVQSTSSSRLQCWVWCWCCCCAEWSGKHHSGWFTWSYKIQLEVDPHKILSQSCSWMCHLSNCVCMNT